MRLTLQDQWCFSSHWCLFDSLWLHEANPWSQHELNTQSAVVQGQFEFGVNKLQYLTYLSETELYYYTTSK